MLPFNLPFGEKDRVVELGGGDVPVYHPNVDIRPGPKVDIVADLNERLPFKDGEWDGVFSQFLMEHLKLSRVRPFLGEVHRILRPGGMAIIITANLLEQAHIIIERETTDELINMIFGGNPDYEENYHHSSLTPSYAVRMLREAGFYQVQVFEHPVAKQIMGRSTDMILVARKSGAIVRGVL